MPNTVTSAWYLPFQHYGYAVNALYNVIGKFSYTPVYLAKQTDIFGSSLSVIDTVAAHLISDDDKLSGEVRKPFYAADYLMVRIAHTVSRKHLIGAEIPHTFKKHCAALIKGDLLYIRIFFNSSETLLLTHFSVSGNSFKSLLAGWEEAKKTYGEEKNSK